MSTLFKNANVLNLNEESGLMCQDVLVKDGKINKISNNIVEQCDNIIDLHGNILMPGFVNAHAHIIAPLLKKYAYKDYIKFNADIVELENQLSYEDIKVLTKKLLLDSFKSGITVTNLITPNYQASVEAVIELNCNACISYSINDLENQYKIIDNDKVKTIVTIKNIFDEKEEDINKLVALSKNKGLQLGVHISETLLEVGDTTVKLGITPPQYLEELGILDRQCIVYGPNHADKDDLQILSNYNAKIVFCPTSSMKFANGISPVFTAIQTGLKVMLGSDYQTPDILNEIQLTSLLTSATMNKQNLISDNELFNMATNATHLFGYDAELKVGKKANLVVVETADSHWYPTYGIISQMLECARISDIRMTMIDGLISYDKNNNSDMILRQINQKVDEIFKRINK